jgi:hypothetical protein
VFLAAVLDDQPVRIGKACHACERAHTVARELVFQHLDLVVERHGEPRAEVLAFDVLLDSIGEAVKSALPPSGKIEDCLTQRLGGDRPGVDGNAAHAQPVLDDQHALAELRRLDGGPPPGRPAADHNEFERLSFSHCEPLLPVDRGSLG